MGNPHSLLPHLRQRGQHPVLFRRPLERPRLGVRSRQRMRGARTQVPAGLAWFLLRDMRLSTRKPE
jgi:hypothetical protein